MKLNKRKLIKTIIALFVLFALLFGSALSTSVGTLAQDGKPPRDEPSGEDGGGGDGGGGDGGSTGATGADIYGTITDLTTGQPGSGLYVRVNDIQVRADARGTWSLTGMSPGTYNISLELPQSEWTPAQGARTVTVSGNERVEVDLGFYEGPAPVSEPAAAMEPPAAPTVEAPAEPGPEAPAELPDAGGIMPDEEFLPLMDAEPVPAVSDAQTILPESDAQNLLPAPPKTVFPAVLCDTIYVVRGGDVLSQLAEFFLGSASAYPRILEATAASRVEDSTFANIINPSLIRPGYQLCIPPE